MAQCKDCKWYSAHVISAMMGQCNLPLEDKAEIRPTEAFQIEKIVHPTDEACEYFVAGKYSWKDH